MKGFTLIELIVTITIVLLLSGGAIVQYNAFTDNQRLKQAALTLKSNFRFAQSKAASGTKPASGCSELVGWDVRFSSSTSYEIQAQCTPQGSVGEITVATLPAGITFSPVPATITFRVLNQGVRTNPTVTLVGRLKSYQIRVNPGGDITDLGFQ